MSHTNSTANYNLPQFISTDVPGWMSDVNSAMSDIDSAMHDNAVAVSANTTDITAIQTQLTDMLPLAGSTGALLQKTATGAEWQSIADVIYPVGSIYITTSAVNPATLFGGSWQRIQDRFLLAAGTIYQNGTTGGSSQHTLTVNEMPPHTHDFRNQVLGYVGAGEGAAGLASGNSWNGTASMSYGGNNVESSGGGYPFNIMPPYLAVMVWERVA